MCSIQKIIISMKEENDRCTIGNNEEAELAEFNLFQIEKLESLLRSREQSIYITGLLGYPLDERYINISSMLMEHNKFEDVINCIHDINLYNVENNTCAKISIAGSYPSIKEKDADGEAIDRILTKNNIFI